jgi:hypothetical protein
MTDTPMTDTLNAMKEWQSQGEEYLAMLQHASRMERERAELIAALESAAATIQQLVDIGRMPANNKGLRDARALLAKVRS